MKRQFVVILALFVVCYYTLDCNSPMLKKENNENAPSTHLTTPEKAEDSISVCRHLVGKESCCSTAHFNEIAEKFKGQKGKFEKKRKEQAQVVRDIENDITKNIEKDAENYANTQELTDELLADADPDADKAPAATTTTAKPAASTAKPAASTDKKPATRLLGSLRFLARSLQKKGSAKGGSKGGSSGGKKATCGNGKQDGNEKCDDGNTKNGDGCAGNCLRIEQGWTCTARKGSKTTGCKKSSSSSSGKKQPAAGGKGSDKKQPAAGKGSDKKQPAAGKGSAAGKGTAAGKGSAAGKGTAAGKGSAAAKGTAAGKGSADKKKTKGPIVKTARTYKAQIKPKSTNAKKGKMNKKGRSAKEGGRLRPTDDMKTKGGQSLMKSDGKGGTKRKSFAEMKKMVKGKGGVDPKTGKKMSSYERKKPTIKGKDGKVMKKPEKKDKNGKRKTKEMIVKEKKEYRGAKKTADKNEFKKTMEAYKKKVTEQRNNLVKVQRNCFRQLLRFTAGAMCLACDADYSKVLQKNSETSYTLKVNKKSCANLVTVCYDYLVERANSGQFVRELQQQKQTRKKSTDLEGQIKAMEKCASTENGCSTKDKENLIKGVDQIETKDVETDAKRVAELKKISGGDKKAPMSVKMPDGCNSNTDCQWICDNMADAKGAKDDGVDMKNEASIDGSTKAPKRVLTKRTLAAVTISTSYTDTGYEPDSEEITKDFNTDMSETVETTAGSSWTVGLSLLSIFLLLWKY